MMRTFPTLRRAGAREREGGVVLIFALIALALLMIGAVAVMRSMGSTQFAIGNLGFKRDMANQAELALVRVDEEFTTGDLKLPISRETNQIGANYSATTLTTNAQGLPLALIDDSLFGAVGSTGKDITTANGLVIRYLIDRLSNQEGECDARTYTNCVHAASSTGDLGGSGGDTSASPPPDPLYRLTVRVTGPRGTQSFFQSTFTY